MAPRRRPHRDIEHCKLEGTSNEAKQLAGYLPMVSCAAAFPVEVFQTVLDDIVANPELLSNNILRAELLGNLPLQDAQLHRGLEVYKHFRRKLLPARLHDTAIDQTCTFYAGEGEALVLLEPELGQNREVPYFHPDAAGIAFRYLSDCDRGATLQIDMKPRSDAIKDGGDTSRLYRTSLALLTNVRKRGEGLHLRNYQKRVHHDRLVPRDEVQDMRMTLKAKYAWIISDWRESTPAEKHVFEDICIASYLIVLWKYMYADQEGKPRCFYDLGCGNGLLTFILTQEGSAGTGIDLRSRKSWQLWRLHSPSVRLEIALLNLPQCVIAGCDETLPLRDAFLIGNHADELTPWIPLLATTYDASGFVNIPCCAHDLAGRFTHFSYRIASGLWPSKTDQEAYESVTLERSGRYAAYVDRIAELTLQCGWIPEREMLRTASTRNAAIIGRRRFDKRPHLVANVAAMAQGAQEAGWQPKPKDGRDH